MAELAYREVYSMNKIAARRRLIQTYKQTGGIRATAHIWKTSPQVDRVLFRADWGREFGGDTPAD